MDATEKREEVGSFDDRLIHATRESIGDRNVQAAPTGRSSEAAAFEGELETRLHERPKDFVNDVAAKRPSIAGRARKERGSSNLALFAVIGVIALLAFFILVVDGDDTDGASGSSGEVSTEWRAPIPEPTHRSTGPINAFNHAIKHYDNHVAGRLEVTHETSDLSVLQQSLRGEQAVSAGFGGAKEHLIGGGTEQVRGKQVPMYVYGDDDTQLFVTEVPWQSIIDEEVFYLTDDVSQQLEAGENVWAPAPSRGTIVAYIEGDILVIAAANRSRPDLANMLSR